MRLHAQHYTPVGLVICIRQYSDPSHPTQSQAYARTANASPETPNNLPVTERQTACTVVVDTHVRHDKHTQLACNSQPLYLSLLVFVRLSLSRTGRERQINIVKVQYYCFLFLLLLLLLCNTTMIRHRTVV